MEDEHVWLKRTSPAVIGELIIMMIFMMGIILEIREARARQDQRYTEMARCKALKEKFSGEDAMCLCSHERNLQ